MIIGLDYTYNNEFKIYRQALYQLVIRGKELGKRSIHLGFSAGIEKKKLGAIPSPVYAFMQSKDNFNAQALATMDMARMSR
jgi:hypothetical protein